MPEEEIDDLQNLGTEVMDHPGKYVVYTDEDGECRWRAAHILQDEHTMAGVAIDYSESQPHPFVFGVAQWEVQFTVVMN